MMNKAQIKIGEIIGIVFIVYIFIFGGIFFFSTFSAQSSQELQNVDSFYKAFNAYLFITNSPLFRESKDGKFDSSISLSKVNLEVFKANQDELQEKFASNFRNSEANIIIFGWDGKSLFPEEEISLFILPDEEKNGNRRSFFNLVNIVAANGETKIAMIQVDIYYN